MLTEAEVMAKLGLRPWAEVQKDARCTAQVEEDRLGTHVSSFRRSGRTWRMLVGAVVEASRGKRVIIEGHRNDYEQELRHQAREWCRRCGVDPERIALRLTRAEARGWQGGVVYLTDHYVFEQQWEKRA